MPDSKPTIAPRTTPTKQLEIFGFSILSHLALFCLTLPVLKARGFLAPRRDLLRLDCSNQSSGLNSPSVARIKSESSGMPYRTQSPTEDISRGIVVSIHHAATLTSMGADG